MYMENINKTVINIVKYFFKYPEHTTFTINGYLNFIIVFAICNENDEINKKIKIYNEKFNPLHDEINFKFEKINFHTERGQKSHSYVSWINEDFINNYLRKEKLEKILKNDIY